MRLICKHIYTWTCKTLQPEYLAYVAYLSSGFNIPDMRSTEWILYALQKSENKTNTGLLNYLNFSACLFRVCIILSIWISRFGNEFVKMYSSKNRSLYMVFTEKGQCLLCIFTYIKLVDIGIYAYLHLCMSIYLRTILIQIPKLTRLNNHQVYVMLC